MTSQDKIFFKDMHYAKFYGLGAALAGIVPKPLDRGKIIAGCP